MSEAKKTTVPTNTAKLGGVHAAVVDRIKLSGAWPMDNPNIKKSFEMKKRFEEFQAEIAVFMAPLNADVGRTIAVMDMLRQAKDEAINAVALGQITGPFVGVAAAASMTD